MSHPREAIIQGLVLLLTPLARLCVRNAYSLQDVIEAVKIAFVRVGAQELTRRGARVNASRISVLTGVYRKDVVRIHVRSESAPEQRVDPVVKILGRWLQDPHFQTKQGEPRVLSWGGPESEFQQLVDSVSQHVGAPSALFELQRRGIVKLTPKGVKVLRTSFTVDGDLLKAYELAAKDYDSLILAAEENALRKNTTSNLHHRTEYDNIAPRFVPEIRRWLLDQGKVFHKRAREYLSALDIDLNPELGDGQEPEEGVAVVIGAFSVVCPRNQMENVEQKPAQAPKRGRTTSRK